MKPYSVDLRERVLAAIDRGMARSEVVTTFNIGLASLKRWLSSRRDTGDFRPRPPTGGQEATFTPLLDDELRTQVAAFPDATLPQHAERWNATHQVHISHWTIGRAIRRLGLSRKKSR
jgi:transposase